MSILLIYESAQPGANFFVGHAVDFGVPYISLTISLNIIVTGLICGRLLYLRNEVNKILGPTHAKMYTSIIAILVESAALFTILGIVYVVVYARKSQTSIALVQVWGDFCVRCNYASFSHNLENLSKHIGDITSVDHSSHCHGSWVDQRHRWKAYYPNGYI